jgi:hypothetical protein
MNIVGGILLYLGSVTTLLAAAAFAAGTFLLDPGGEPPAPTTFAAQAAPPAKPVQKPKEGQQDVAKLHPVAPSASAVPVRPSVEWPATAARPKIKDRKSQTTKGAIRVRPMPPAHAIPRSAHGFASPQKPPMAHYRQ